ncbi:Poly-beta-1,6-N-acetyl-D-glucosamine synthase [Maioricimonas rarisocia]|uniref:Poly-beta-1,6-N-acetyl-D-glucosamine synthase n=1 Tax=Maioricimonas rarisocia TaxID=2528026 RepID=A0A517Z0S6_9PLAN|nr:glycosyltransferase family 2 protein [Maioricimonas rarisocia]QDU36083.1 Poly-beta-1,6-N-acetyl-D-glucosamine synthase [Maioricimonas rarisocia]
MIELFWLTLGVTLYAYMIYPLLLWSLSALRKAHAWGESAALPGIAIVIPAHNEEAVLKAKLENALSLDYPADKLEIIVASDGSRDGTVRIGRTFEDRGVRLLDFAKRRGKASVLNDAVAATKSELLCLCDANVMFAPDALKRLVACLRTEGVGAATGDVRLSSEDSDFSQGEGLYYRIERAMQVGESVLGTTICVDGGMYVMRRELFRPLRPDTILDDFVTSLNIIRQGYRIVYVPEAVATENATPCWKQEFRRRIRVTTGAAQVLFRGDWPRPWQQPIACFEFVSHKLLRWIGPFLLLAVLVTNVAVADSGPVYLSLLIGQMLFYGLAALGWLSAAAREFAPVGVPFYFTMSHCAVAVGLLKGLFVKQQGTWERTPREPVVASSQHPSTSSQQPASSG